MPSQPHTPADGRAHAGGRLAEINSLQGEIGSSSTPPPATTAAITGRKRSGSNAETRETPISVGKLGTSRDKSGPLQRATAT